MLYYSMQHRTQLYLDDSQYRWLKQQAGQRGSIAAVVRELIEAARSQRQSSGRDPLIHYLIESARSDRPSPAGDPLIRYLLEDPAADGEGASTVATIDHDLYG